MTRAATSLLGEEDEATVRAAYPGLTWDRLRELKRRDDPDNLFRLNHNRRTAENSASGQSQAIPARSDAAGGRRSALLTQPEAFAAAC
jgi:hypothetical protein